MALNQSGLFSSAIKGDKGDYKLSVKILNVDQPLFGGSFTVNMSTHWQMTDQHGRELFQDFVRSSFTATMGDAFAAATRLRLATEGAARENIKEGIQRLSTLQL